MKSRCRNGGIRAGEPHTSRVGRQQRGHQMNADGWLTVSGKFKEPHAEEDSVARGWGIIRSDPGAEGVAMVKERRW